MSEPTLQVIDVIERFKALVERSMTRLDRIESRSLLTSDQLWESLSNEQRALQSAATDAINQLAKIRATVE